MALVRTALASAVSTALLLAAPGSECWAAVARAIAGQMPVNLTAAPLPTPSPTLQASSLLTETVLPQAQSIPTGLPLGAAAAPTPFASTLVATPETSESSVPSEEESSQAGLRFDGTIQNLAKGQSAVSVPTQGQSGTGRPSAAFRLQPSTPQRPAVQAVPGQSLGNFIPRSERVGAPYAFAALAGLVGTFFLHLHSLPLIFLVMAAHMAVLAPGVYLLSRNQAMNVNKPLADVNGKALQSYAQEVAVRRRPAWGHLIPHLLTSHHAHRLATLQHLETLPPQDDELVALLHGLAVSETTLENVLSAVRTLGRSATPAAVSALKDLAPQLPRLQTEIEQALQSAEDAATLEQTAETARTVGSSDLADQLLTRTAAQISRLLEEPPTLPVRSKVAALQERKIRLEEALRAQDHEQAAMAARSLEALLVPMERSAD